MARAKIILLLDILREGSIATVGKGSNLSRIGGFTGVPQKWGFSIEDAFAPFMKFGDVEIHFLPNNNEVRVSYIEFEPHTARKGLLNFANGGQGKVKIRVPDLSELGITAVKEYLTKNNVPFRIDNDEPINDETSVVITTGSKVRLYFMKDKIRTLGLVAIF